MTSNPKFCPRKSRKLCFETATFVSMRGFTIVEIAVVMILIGLLAGGVLKGYQFYRSAMVTATIAQVSVYDEATKIFEQTYGGLPGDLSSANIVLPNCPHPGCAYKHPAHSNSGFVGIKTWEMGFPQQGLALTHLDSSGYTFQTVETTLFWIHLQLADLINGVDPQRAFVAGDWEIGAGITHPSAKVGGIFVVSYAEGTPVAPPLPGWPTTSRKLPNGHFLNILPGPYPYAELSIWEGGDAIDAAYAAAIDRKLDDGIPTDGAVVGFGISECFLDENNYNPNSSGLDCGVAFRLSR